MRRSWRYLFWIGGALLLDLAPVVARADPPRPGDCCKAETIHADGLPPPPLMRGLGDSAIKITTHSEKAQAYFNQGLNLLHCFWEFEAYRAFHEAARLDPSCAMAYWGLYRSLADGRQSGFYEAQSKAALKKAVELSQGASDYERQFIHAYERQETLKGEEADKAFQHDMEALIDRYPADKEARLFLAIHLMRGYDGQGNPVPGQVYCLTLLAGLMRQYPDCAAAHHYWIHALEARHPEEALESARVLGRLAPNSGHMVHMPGHIYYRVGDYRRAREAFLASTHVDAAYMQAQHMHPTDTWNYIHNLDYLVANCAEDGRYQEGRKWALALATVGLDTSRDRGAGDGRILYNAKVAPARLDLRFGRWEEAARQLRPLETDPTLPSVHARRFYTALRQYAEGMAAAERDDGPQAAACADALEKSLAQLSGEQPPSQEQAFYGMQRMLGVSAVELRGCVADRQGDTAKAITLLKQAVEKEQELGYKEPPLYMRPVLESLAAVYRRHGQWDLAQAAYTQELTLRPNSGHALYGLACCYRAAGKSAEAEVAAHHFLEAWREADTDLPQVRDMKRLLAGRETDAVASTTLRPHDGRERKPALGEKPIAFAPYP